jgi:hypothetical protein
MNWVSKKKMCCSTILGIDGMPEFIGTLIIVSLSCLAMSIGLLLAGRPFSGGCGNRPGGGASKCETCPNRKRGQAMNGNKGGESGC